MCHHSHFIKPPENLRNSEKTTEVSRDTLIIETSAQRLQMVENLNDLSIYTLQLFTGINSTFNFKI